MYDIYHKQKYTVCIRKELWEDRVILQLLDNKKVLDSITIINVRGITKSETFSNIFLSLTFSRRAGSGIGVRLTKLLSIRAGKLFESLFLFTTHREESYLYNENYMVIFDLRGMSYKDFSLSIKESEYLDDKTEKPARHEEWEKTFTIPFDAEEMIFANGQTTLDGEFKFVIFKIHWEKMENKQLLTNKRVKKLILKKQAYIHIDNKWYAEKKDKTLLEM
jgi:hypothetical protein